MPELINFCEYEPRELHAAGASAVALLKAGVATPELLREAGCTAAEVKTTGAFSRQQMEACPPHALGCNRVHPPATCTPPPPLAPGCHTGT